jgi:hypothetical protein
LSTLRTSHIRRPKNHAHGNFSYDITLHNPPDCDLSKLLQKIIRANGQDVCRMEPEAFRNLTRTLAYRNAHSTSAPGQIENPPF